MRTRAMLMTPGLSRFYYMLIQQRGLPWEALAAEMGVGVRNLKNTLMSTTVEVKTKRGARRTRWKAVAIERLDALEAAITKLTDQRGGVHRSSGTTPAGLAEIRRQLDEHRIYA